jgi:hypothetical protein
LVDEVLSSCQYSLIKIFEKKYHCTYPDKICAVLC